MDLPPLPGCGTTFNQCIRSLDSTYWSRIKYIRLFAAARSADAKTSRPHAWMWSQQRERGRLGRHSHGTVCGRAQRLQTLLRKAKRVLRLRIRELLQTALLLVVIFVVVVMALYIHITGRIIHNTHLPYYIASKM
jgi:hypothetical protein